MNTEEKTKAKQLGLANENLPFGNGGFNAAINPGTAHSQRPSFFNGPTLNGGDQSAVNINSTNQELSRMEEGQLAVDQNQEIPYGPLNREEAENPIGRDPAVAIPLPSSDIDPDKPTSTSSALIDDNRRYEDALDENEHRYVGLVNQAMTCYLNSLIQTLYMTPEFRNAIYKWNSGKLAEEANNIPYQLQKLFLLLQTSEKSSLETKELTASFGWESNEAYDQHDVQELCRIMFDALEHRWRKTENRSLIQDLYKGTMEDYVKCLKCGTENARRDAFLDLPLPIKPFGATQSYKSIEEALSEFIRPEVLSGNNQYQCAKCAGMQDADKGLRIIEFPYLLTIQLKRFDFDYQTLHRIKLNDRITFPDYLDINDFVYAPPTPKISYAAAAKKHKPEPGCSKNPESPPEDPFMGPTSSNAVAEQNDENKIEKREWLNVSVNSEPIQQMLKRGKYVYELFSIMVHQGSAAAGHYFAYIKNMDQNRWFCFNDSSVQAAPFSDIYRTFGATYSYGYMNNMNAYMLMYRQVMPEKNRHFIRSLDLPQNLKDLHQRLKTEEEERERQHRHEQELVKINFICNEERCMAKDPEGKFPYSLLMHKDVSLDTVFTEIITKLDSNGIDPLAEHSIPMTNYTCSRLISCESNWEMERVVAQYPDLHQQFEMPTIEMEGGETFVVGNDDDLKRPLESLLPSTGIHIFRHELFLMLDTKPRDDLPFYELPPVEGYRYNDVRTYEVWLVDLGAGEVRFGKRVCFHQDRTVEEFKRLLAELLPAVAKTEQACQQYVVNHMEELRRKKAEEQSQQSPTIANGYVDEKEGKQKVDNEMLSQVAGTSAADHPIQMVPADDAEEAVVPEIPVDRENSVPDNAGSAENDDKKGQEAEAAQASDNEMDKGSNSYASIVEKKQPLCILVFDRNDRSSREENDQLFQRTFKKLCFTWEKNNAKMSENPSAGFGSKSTVFVSVGCAQMIIDEYKNDCAKLRDLIETTKFTARIRVVLPFKEEMVLFRQQLQQQQQQLMLTSSTHPIVEELPQENISTDGTKNTTRSGGGGGGNGTAVDPQELKSAISHLDVTGGTRKSTPSEKASELVIPVPAKISTAAQTADPPFQHPRPVAIVPPTIVQKPRDKLPPAHDMDIMEAAVPPSPVVQEPIPAEYTASTASVEGYSLDDPTPPPPYPTSGFESQSAKSPESEDNKDFAHLIAKYPGAKCSADFAIPQLPPPGFEPDHQPNKSHSDLSMVCHPGEDVVMGGEQEEDEEDLQSGDDGEQQQLLLPGDDVDDPMMGLSSCPSTPKISPVVSEASGDESAQETRDSSMVGGLRRWEDDGMRRKREKQRVSMNMERVNMLYSQRDNFRDASSTVAATATTITEMATTTTELGSRGEADSVLGIGTASQHLPSEDPDFAATSDTLVGGTESTGGSTATASLGGGAAEGVVETSNASRSSEWIQLLEEVPGDAQTRSHLLLKADKRSSARLFKPWLGCYLQLKDHQFQIQKHYTEQCDGYPFFPAEHQNFIDCSIGNINYFSIKLLAPPSAVPSPTGSRSGGDQQNDKKENSNRNAGRRRERPLRIKIMSQSESEDQPVA